MLSPAQIHSYDQNGYLVLRGLFSPEEVAALRDHYMELRLQGKKPGDYSGVDPKSAEEYFRNDPLKKYPRMIHMHRWDQVSLDWMLDRRIAEILTQLTGTEPYAVQSMIYFKPPQARGQALHQDQYYLRVQPGTCIAAWMALDRCDEENGCLQVVPGSQTWPLLCTTKADTTLSFTDVTVPIPAGTLVHNVVMEPGDMLFFNGQVVHGSGPNHSQERFRRSLIGHYVVGEAQKVAEFYHPALRMDGTVVDLELSQGGGSCGVWVEQDGEVVIELAGGPGEGLAGRTE
jgi:ectoine hydroxylase-related dioxygenase (phytanoyl-CoA dioxygenase family)